jgi:hypothetical protein
VVGTIILFIDGDLLSWVDLLILLLHRHILHAFHRHVTTVEGWRGRRRDGGDNGVIWSIISRFHPTAWSILHRRRALSPFFTLLLKHSIFSSPLVPIPSIHELVRWRCQLLEIWGLL